MSLLKSRVGLRHFLFVQMPRMPMMLLGMTLGLLQPWLICGGYGIYEYTRVGIIVNSDAN